MSGYDGFYHYLPVNDAAMLWGMYLTGLGSGVVPAGEEYPPRVHPGLYQFRWSAGRVLPEFQLILITDGSGEFESEPTGHVTVVPGTVLVLFPGIWHRYRPCLDTGWTERWISFNGSMAHRLPELQLLDPKLAVRKVDTPAKLAPHFDQLINRIHEDPNQNSILLSFQTMALIGLSVELTSTNEELPGGDRTVRNANVSDPIVAQALDLIWTQSHRPLAVNQYADQLSVSRRVLERHFRTSLGHTVLDEIAACRLSRAKRLLQETELGVKSIAYMSGFPSAERMRIAFLRGEKKTPSQYRIEARSR